MTWSSTALAVALLSFALAAGCNDYNSSIQYNTGATLLNIAPTGAVLGSPDLTLTVTSAGGFLNTTVVQWNGQKLATTFVDSVTLTAVVPHTLIAKAGSAFVNTLTPQSGKGNNGLSNSLTFLIYGSPNPVPTLNSVSPTSTATCASKCANVTITLAGQNFLPSSTNGSSTVAYTGVATNGVQTAINTTSISSSQIQAVIPGTFLANPDTASIVVINPPGGVCLLNCPNLGGGTSSAAPFTIGGGAQSQSATASAAMTAAEETPAVSQDGRYVAFASQQNDTTQILLRDTCIGASNSCTPSTQVVSAALDGSAGNADSHSPSISADARYVAFSSAATNLMENSPEGRQVYLRDTCVGAAASCKPSTSLVSTDSAGALTGAESILPSISSSGRFIAFVAVTPSASSNTSKSSGAASAAKSPAGSTSSTSPNSGLRQVFVRDTCLGASGCTPKTTRISLAPGDDSSTPKPAAPSVSGEAKQIALPNGKTATVFTPTIAVDDRVFLAITNQPK